MSWRPACDLLSKTLSLIFSYIKGSKMSVECLNEDMDELNAGEHRHMHLRSHTKDKKSKVSAGEHRHMRLRSHASEFAEQYTEDEENDDSSGEEYQPSNSDSSSKIIREALSRHEEHIMLIQAEGEDEENRSGKPMGLRLEENLSGNSDLTDYQDQEELNPSDDEENLEDTDLAGFEESRKTC
ncbi:hypothetical protein ACROYT_G043795 [Oculina patagonica]